MLKKNSTNPPDASNEAANIWTELGDDWNLYLAEMSDGRKRLPTDNLIVFTLDRRGYITEAEDAPDYIGLHFFDDLTLPPTVADFRDALTDFIAHPRLCKEFSSPCGGRVHFLRLERGQILVVCRRPESAES